MSTPSKAPAQKPPLASPTRFLRKSNGDPHLYPYTERLAKRGDMIECDAKGNPVQNGTIPSAPTPFRPRPVNVPKNPDEVPQAAGVGDTPELAPPARPAPPAPSGAVDVTPEAPVDPAIAEAQEARKAQLIKFAQDRFKLTLDPEDSLEVIEKRVAKKMKVKTLPENLE